MWAGMDPQIPIGIWYNCKVTIWILISSTMHTCKWSDIYVCRWKKGFKMYLQYIYSTAKYGNLIVTLPYPQNHRNVIHSITKEIIWICTSLALCGLKQADPIMKADSLPCNRPFAGGTWPRNTYICQIHFCVQFGVRTKYNNIWIQTSLTRHACKWSHIYDGKQGRRFTQKYFFNCQISW